MKTTVDLPSDLLREIKLRAVNEGRKLREVISDLLRFGLMQGSAPTEVSVPQKGKITLPLFPCSSNSPASRMSVEALISLEQAAQEEGDHVCRG